MGTIGKRIAALEARAGVGRDLVGVIIRTICQPGIKREVRKLATFQGDWSIEREAGETEAEFLARAADAAPRSAGAVVRLVEQLSQEAAS